MWNLKLEFENRARAVANAKRVHAEVAAFCQEQRRLTLVGVAPQAGGPRAWAPLLAAGMAPRPDGRRSGVER